MQLQKVSMDKYSIQSYDYARRNVVINNQHHNNVNLYIFDNITVVNTIDDISLDTNIPEILIISTGEKQQFMHPSTYKKYIDLGIGVEFMNNDAACRTYNILLSEQRKVALFLSNKA
jgi:uncharacterized protein